MSRGRLDGPAMPIAAGWAGHLSAPGHVIPERDPLAVEGVAARLDAG